MLRFSRSAGANVCVGKALRPATRQPRLCPYEATVRAHRSFSDMDSVVISHFAEAAGRRQPPEAIHICGANFTGGGLVGMCVWGRGVGEADAKWPRLCAGA